MADLREVVNRIKAEGELTRNSGKNSIRWLREDVQNVAEHVHMNTEYLLLENRKIGKLYEKQIKTMEGQRYDLLETVKESNENEKRKLKLDEQESKKTKLQNKSDSPMFGNLFTFLGANALVRTLGRFLRFGGVIGAATGVGIFLFDVFKKIAEDPRYEEFKTNWATFKENLASDWDRLNKSFENQGYQLSPDFWEKRGLLDFASNVTTQIADTIIGVGNTLLDPKKGFWEKYTGVVDSFVTNFIQLFNPQAFGDGTFLSTMNDGLNNLADFIVMKYDNASNAISKLTERANLNMAVVAGDISQEEFEKKMNEIDFKYRNKSQIKFNLEQADKYINDMMSTAEGNIYTSAANKIYKDLFLSGTGLYEYMNKNMTPNEIEAFLNSNSRYGTALRLEYEKQMKQYLQDNPGVSTSSLLGNVPITGTMLEDNIDNSNNRRNNNIIIDNSSRNDNYQGGGAYIGPSTSVEDFVYNRISQGVY